MIRPSADARQLSLGDLDSRPIRAKSDVSALRTRARMAFSLHILVTTLSRPAHLRGYLKVD